MKSYSKVAKKYNYRGEYLTISEIAKKEGVNNNTIRYRIKKTGGWESTVKTYTYKGEQLTFSEIAIKEGLTREAVFMKLKKNKDFYK